MKKTWFILSGLLALLPVLRGNGAALSAEATISGAKKDAKILVAYFSRADENYGVGVIEKGNTQILAEFIADYVNADQFHIKTVSAYPKTYKECVEKATQERNQKARPELAGPLPDLSGYDIVFLGYPIWWGDMPMALYTFLENGDFAGKTIIPFCTHEGSGASKTAKSIQSACPKAKVQKAFAMRGKTAQNARDAAKKEVLKWIDSIKLQ